jgi:hypothetical protein
MIRPNSYESEIAANTLAALQPAQARPKYMSEKKRRADKRLEHYCP